MYDICSCLATTVYELFDVGSLIVDDLSLDLSTTMNEYGSGLEPDFED